MGMFDPNITYTVDGVEIDPATQALPSSYRRNPYTSRFNELVNRWSKNYGYTPEGERINQYDWMLDYVNSNDIAWAPQFHDVGTHGRDAGTDQAIAAWNEFQSQLDPTQVSQWDDAYKAQQEQARWDALTPFQQQRILAEQARAEANKEYSLDYLMNTYGLSRQGATDVIAFTDKAYRNEKGRDQSFLAQLGQKDLNNVFGRMLSGFQAPNPADFQTTRTTRNGTVLTQPMGGDLRRAEREALGQLGIARWTPRPTHPAEGALDRARVGGSVGGSVGGTGLFSPSIFQTGGLTPAAYQQQPTPFSPTVKPPFGRADGTAQDLRSQPQTMFGQTPAATSVTQNNLLNSLTNKIKSQRAAVLKNLFGM